MRNKTMNRLWPGVGAAVLLCAAGSAQAAGHTYVPFGVLDNTNSFWTGLWLADTANLGNPPVQLTNQQLDGPLSGVQGGSPNVTVLNDWTLNTTTHEATNVVGQLVVYGVGGHLFSADLKTIGPVQQFSSGNYGELCSLNALDARPFAAARSFVQAVVEPVGSANTCASGVGTQTWLIPANATAATAPMIEPGNWAVLGAFTNPTDGSFVRWIVWTGNEVVAYKANFSSATTLLVGPPAGPAPEVLSRVDGNAVLASSSDNGVTHTDTFYHVSMTGSGLMSSLSNPDTSPCFFGSTFVNAVTDSGTGTVLILENTAGGYGVYSAPIAGGAVSQIYADSSGANCGQLAGDSPSAGHVAVNLTNTGTGNEVVIGVNETGPVSQTPVAIAGSDTVIAVDIYAINGHLWILEDDFSSGSDVFATLVADGDGTVVQSYPNTRIRNDMWAGFLASGQAPSVDRAVVYLFGNPGVCSGGSLTAINTTSFAATPISGVPADACTAAGFGWQPATVGSVKEPAGDSPTEVDPVAGKMYILLGPITTGAFQNLSTVSSFPFY